MGEHTGKKGNGRREQVFSVLCGTEEPICYPVLEMEHMREKCYAGGATECEG